MDLGATGGGAIVQAAATAHDVRTSCLVPHGRVDMVIADIIKTTVAEALDEAIRLGCARQVGCGIAADHGIEQAEMAGDGGSKLRGRGGREDDRAARVARFVYDGENGGIIGERRDVDGDAPGNGMFQRRATARQPAGYREQ